MSPYAVAQDGQQSQARALTPTSCAGGSVWPLSAQHAATCTGRGSARAAPSSCAAPHHCISLLPFSSRTGKEEGAAPSRSQKGTAAAKEGGWWWWGFGNSTAGGVRQPTATLPTDAEQTVKLHRGWDGALLPPCWSCHTMPPSLPQQQCNWAPPQPPPTATVLALEPCRLLRVGSVRTAEGTDATTCPREHKPFISSLLCSQGRGEQLQNTRKEPRRRKRRVQHTQSTGTH